MRERFDRCSSLIQRVQKIAVLRADRYQLLQYLPRLFKVFARQFRVMQIGLSSTRICKRYGVIDCV